MYRAALSATAPTTAIGIDLRGFSVSSAIEAAASNPMNSVTANRIPLNTAFHEVSFGLNTASVLPPTPPLAMITTDRNRNGIAETEASSRTPRIASLTPKWLSVNAIARPAAPPTHHGIEVWMWLWKKPWTRNPRPM